MTINNQTSTVTHNGNGVTTVWPYAFIIPDAAAARVGLFDIATSALTLLDDTDYSINGINDPNGGEVTYPLMGSPIAATKRIVIWREVDYTQETDLTNQTPYYPEVLEEQLDRIVMQIQQLAAEAERALKVTAGSNLDPDTFIAELQAGAAVATQQAAIATAAAEAAALSAASIDLPDTPIALNYMRQKGDLTGFEYRTPAQTADDVSAVRYDASTALSTAQQGQARANSGAGVISGFRNKLINPTFTIGQRGTSGNILAGATGWVGDRWLLNNGTNQTVSWSITAGISSPGALPLTIRNYLVFNFSIAPTTGDVLIYQNIEDVTTLAGDDATLTGYYSFVNSAQLIQYVIQSFGTGGSTAVQVNGTSALMAAGGFTRRSDKLALAAVSGKTFGANNCLSTRTIITPRHAASNYILGGMSLVRGDALAESDPFSPRHPQQEQALCDRYYQLLTVGGLGYAPSAAFGFSYAFQNKTEMRGTPTGAELSTISVSSSTFSSISGLSPRGGYFVFVSTSSGGIGRIAVISLDAELPA